MILDTGRRVGKHGASGDMVRTNYCKEDISRRYILNRPGQELNFLDIGSGNGRLDYLLGTKRNLAFELDFYNHNKMAFDAKYSYYGLDVASSENINVLVGDICDPKFLAQHITFRESFDVVYSNNVFEHLYDPFSAARNIFNLCKFGGLIITIVPFSQRFHQSPDDFFRYTHRGVEQLFQHAGHVEVRESGYDISGRRNNWQGTGLHNDLVPEDKFGAWRETWFTICVMEKCEL